MTPETEVIACPACQHLVRVPLDWLGTQVQCPECKAMFRATVRQNGGPTRAELISRPAPEQASPRKPDLMLMLPAFGLLFCGVAGVIVNAVILYQMQSHPGGGTAWAKERMIPSLRQVGFGTPGTPEEQAAEDERNAGELARTYSWVLPLSLAVSAVVFVGGLSIVRRKNYRLARFACVLAALNVAHGCCIPGAVAGLWGLLMLNSDEARDHFGA